MSKKVEKFKIVVETSDRNPNHCFQSSRVSVEKGHECIALDIDYEKSIVHIWATCRSGGYTVASLRFEEDEVVQCP